MGVCGFPRRVWAGTRHVGPPWNRACDKGKFWWDNQPDLNVCLCDEVSNTRGPPPKSCLRCAEIRFLRWFGRWCSVGRRDLLHWFGLSEPIWTLSSLEYLTLPTYPAALQDFIISTESEFSAGLGKLPQTTDAKVLLIHLFGCNNTLCLGIKRV